MLTNAIITLIYGISAPFRYCIRRTRSFRNRLYSKWICRKYGFEGNITFGSPINRISNPGKKHIRIGDRTRFGKMAVITAWDRYRDQRFAPSITIGERCDFGDYLHITSIDNISIGNGVLTGRWVTITDNSHGNSHLLPPPQFDSSGREKAHVKGQSDNRR